MIQADTRWVRCRFAYLPSLPPPRTTPARTCVCSITCAYNHYARSAYTHCACYAPHLFTDGYMLFVVTQHAVGGAFHQFYHTRVWVSLLLPTSVSTTDLSGFRFPGFSTFSRFQHRLRDEPTFHLRYHRRVLTIPVWFRRLVPILPERANLRWPLRYPGAPCLFRCLVPPIEHDTITGWLTGIDARARKSRTTSNVNWFVGPSSPLARSPYATTAPSWLHAIRPPVGHRTATPRLCTSATFCAACRVAFCTPLGWSGRKSCQHRLPYTVPFK